MKKVKDANTQTFKELVLDSETPVLVDFWAPWCGPCLMMAPILDQLAEDGEVGSKLNIVKINTEEGENQMLAFQYQVRGIPNMKLFYKGKVVKEFVGARPQEMFKSELLQELAQIGE